MLTCDLKIGDRVRFITNQGVISGTIKSAAKNKRRVYYILPDFETHGRTLRVCDGEIMYKLADKVKD